VGPWFRTSGKSDGVMATVMNATFGRVKALSEVLTVFVFDLGTLFAVFYSALFLRINILPRLYPAFPAEVPFRSLSAVWWVFLIWLFFFYYEGLYTRRFAFWDEIRAICHVSILATVGVFTIVSVGKFSEEVSRTVIVLMGLLSLFLLPAERILLKKTMRRFGLLKRRVLILGAGETGKLILKALKREPNYGYEVVGFLDDDCEKVGKKIDGVKIHRGVERAENYLKNCGITDLFIAMPGAGKDRLQALVNSLQHKVERVLFVPDMTGIAVLGTGLKHFFHEEVLAFEIENNLSSATNVIIKRCFDLVFSGLALIFLSVPMALIALLIRLDSSGRAIFSQERVGKNGKTFRCFKFRTMYSDAEERLNGILENDPEARGVWERRWKLSADPRITRVGRFLRTTSLDELPQIFNVMKGEMSFVGPRPVTRDEIERHYKDMAKLCFCVLPGITGLWQVSGRSNTSYDYRITLDSWYVRNWNLWLDIVILFKTVRIVIRREGAY